MMIFYKIKDDEAGEDKNTYITYLLQHSQLPQSSQTERSIFA
jgi:hypothetical protein